MIVSPSLKFKVQSLDEVNNICLVGSTLSFFKGVHWSSKNLCYSELFNLFARFLQYRSFMEVIKSLIPVIRVSINTKTLFKFVILNKQFVMFIFRFHFWFNSFIHPYRILIINVYIFFGCIIPKDVQYGFV